MNMKTYDVINSESGHLIGTYIAPTKADALDQAARQVGYARVSDMEHMIGRPCPFVAKEVSEKVAS